MQEKNKNKSFEIKKSIYYVWGNSSKGRISKLSYSKFLYP